jgi:hypothetical protein
MVLQWFCNGGLHDRPEAYRGIVRMTSCLELYSDGLVVSGLWVVRPNPARVLGGINRYHTIPDRYVATAFELSSIS